MIEHIFVFKNKILPKVEVHISAEVLEQAQQILNFIVIQPENFERQIFR